MVRVIFEDGQILPGVQDRLPATEPRKIGQGARRRQGPHEMRGRQSGGGGGGVEIPDSADRGGRAGGAAAETEFEAASSVGPQLGAIIAGASEREHGRAG